MTKWEYKILDSVKLKEEKIISSTLSIYKFEEFLNELGRDGWEIFQMEVEKIGNDVGAFHGIAKRQVR